MHTDTGQHNRPAHKKKLVRGLDPAAQLARQTDTLTATLVTEYFPCALTDTLGAQSPAADADTGNKWTFPSRSPHTTRSPSEPYMIKIEHCRL